MAIDAHVAVAPGSPRPPTFAARHPSDAWFFPSIVGVICLLMLAGFVPEMLERMHGTPKPYPVVIHAHAVVFFGWLAFLASQVALIRTGRVAVHRSLGTLGAVLAVAVLLLGPAAAFTMQLAHDAQQPPKFLAVQLLNIAVFGVLVVAGLVFRRDAAAHKRLMLVATLALIGAGFSRVMRMVMGAPPPFTLIPGVYIAGNVLLVVIALYDYRTRGRLHPAFVMAAALLIGAEFLAGALLRSPAWIEFTGSLFG
jgi:FtsH-binding integral membrane protein